MRYQCRMGFRCLEKKAASRCRSGCALRGREGKRRVLATHPASRLLAKIMSITLHHSVLGHVLFSLQETSISTAVIGLILHSLRITRDERGLGVTLSCTMTITW